MKSKFGSCIYVKRKLVSIEVYLRLYVANMLLATKDKANIERLKSQLSGSFEMKNLDPNQRILGIEITRYKQRRRIFLFLKYYIKKVLERFSMIDSKSISTPLALYFKLASIKLEEKDCEMKYMAPYASVVDSILYAMVYNRPNLAYLASMVSTFISKPSREH